MVMTTSIHVHRMAKQLETVTLKCTGDCVVSVWELGEVSWCLNKRLLSIASLYIIFSTYSLNRILQQKHFDFTTCMAFCSAFV
jgi:hypothetical protein